MPRKLNFKIKPVIGVVHLPPLPGSPGYQGGGVEDIVERAVSDARVLHEGGADAVIVENYGDKPYAVRVRKPETIAVMTVVVREVVRSVPIPVGVSLLRNSGPEALCIAYATGASFIRSNAYCEARVSPEGVLEPVAHEVEYLKSLLQADVDVLADVDCKHSYPLTQSYSVVDAVRECCSRTRPAALIATGSATGEAPPPGYVAAIKSASSLPVVVGSGVTPDNIKAYWSACDGFIVGTYFKRSGVTTNPVDVQRVRKLIELVRELRRKNRLAEEP